MRIPSRLLGLPLGMTFLVALGGCGGGIASEQARNPTRTVATPSPDMCTYYLDDGTPTEEVCAEAQKPPSYSQAPNYPPDTVGNKDGFWWWRNGGWTKNEPPPGTEPSKYQDRWKWDTSHGDVPYDHWDVRKGTPEWRVKPTGTKPSEGEWDRK